MALEKAALAHEGPVPSSRQLSQMWIEVTCLSSRLNVTSHLLEKYRVEEPHLYRLLGVLQCECLVADSSNACNISAVGVLMCWELRGRAV